MPRQLHPPAKRKALMSEKAKPDYVTVEQPFGYPLPLLPAPSAAPTRPLELSTP